MLFFFYPLLFPARDSLICVLCVRKYRKDESILGRFPPSFFFFLLHSFCRFKGVLPMDVVVLISKEIWYQFICCLVLDLFIWCCCFNYLSFFRKQRNKQQLSITFHSSSSIPSFKCSISFSTSLNP